MNFLKLNLISSIFLLLLTACSCEKKNVDPDIDPNGNDNPISTHITATINGREVQTKNAFAIFSETTINWLGLSASEVETGNTIETMTLSVLFPLEGDLEAISYQSAGEGCTDINDKVCIDLHYTIEENNDHETKKTYLCNTTGGDLELIFEETDRVTGGTVKATFSGVLVNSLDQNDQLIVTNGSINASVLR